MSNNERQGKGKEPEKEIPSNRSDDSESSSDHYSEDGFLFTRPILSFDGEPIVLSKPRRNAKDLKRRRLRRRMEMQSSKALPSSSDGKSVNAATPSEHRIQSTDDVSASGGTVDPPERPRTRADSYAPAVPSPAPTGSTRRASALSSATGTSSARTGSGASTAKSSAEPDHFSRTPPPFGATDTPTMSSKSVYSDKKDSKSSVPNQLPSLRKVRLPSLGPPNHPAPYPRKLEPRLQLLSFQMLFQSG